jgi:hypothetical protein
LKQFFDKGDFGISKYDSYDSYASCGFWYFKSCKTWE